MAGLYYNQEVIAKAEAMPLTARQKHFIKRNASRFAISQLAEKTGASEKEIGRLLGKNAFGKSRQASGSRLEGKSRSDWPDKLALGDFFARHSQALIGLFLLTFLCYAWSLGSAFVSDDIAAIRDNSGLGTWQWLSADFPIGFPQKIVQLIAFRTAGLSPWAFRLPNVLFHIGSAFLIFALVFPIAGRFAAFAAGALFAVHPIRIEAVTWISGAPYSIYAFFFLAALLLYAAGKNDRKKRLLSWSCFLIALMTSEKVIPLFLVFWVWEYSFGDLRKNWKRSLPYLGMSLLWLAIFASRLSGRVASVNPGAQEASGDAFYNPLIQIPVAIGTYLKLIFWPAKLSLYQTEMSFGQGQYFLLVLIFLAFILTLAWNFRKSRRNFFWLSLFLISLLVTLAPIKIAWVVAERYVALASVGIIVPIAFLFSRWAEKGETGKRLAYSLFAVLTAALMIRTIERNADWRSEDSLWLATAKVAPSGQNIHNNLGDVYARQGDLGRAAEEFKKAIEIDPRYADAYHNLGNTYQKMGDDVSAEDSFKKALEFNPNLWQSYQALSSIAFEKKDYQSALGYIRKALMIDPVNDSLKQNLETIESQLGR